MSEFEDVPLDSIFCDHDFNSRSYITPTSVGTLAANIEANGLMQPIVLQPYTDAAKPNLKWRIVMGHRRFLATEQLCKRRPDWPKTIKARLGPLLPDDRALVLNIQENMEREQLNILQEAKALKRFENMGWDESRIAKELNKPKQWVHVRLALLLLPEQIQKRAEAGWINQYDIDQLAEMSSDEERFARVREIVDHKLKGESKAKALGKRPIVINRKKLLGQGEPRPVRVLIDYLDWIQDQFNDVKHPAAMALSFAVGIIDEQQFRLHVQEWGDALGIDLKAPNITEDDRQTS